MNNYKEHIGFKILTLLLVMALMVPNLVKLNHLLSHHEHKVCVVESTTHIHKVDLDCEFHKFQLNKSFNFINIEFQLFSPKENSTEILSQYGFLSKYQRLHFSLRGPPALV